MHAVMSILAAVVHRHATGDAQHLDVSVADGVVALMSLSIDEYLATGTVPGPGHNILTGRYACYGVYRCADDRWVAVGAIEPHFYANLCSALGCEQWLSHQLDDDVQDEVRAAFAAAFASRTMADWVEVLAPADTCVSPVATVPELAEDAQYRARDAIVTAHRADAPAFEQVGFVLAGMDHDQAAPIVRDATVTDTGALLAEVGYDADTIASLRAEGAVA
jgi:alpha-methylacyl-CoA racemase